MARTNLVPFGLTLFPGFFYAPSTYWRVLSSNTMLARLLFRNRKKTKRNAKMLKFTASWNLHNALNDMNAPMEIIKMESSIFQGVAKDIQIGTLTPEEGAIIVLDSLGKANYGRRWGDKR